MSATMLGRECPDLGCDVMFSESGVEPVLEIVTSEIAAEATRSFGRSHLLLIGRSGRTTTAQ